MSVKSVSFAFPKTITKRKMLKKNQQSKIETPNVIEHPSKTIRNAVLVGTAEK